MVGGEAVGSCGGGGHLVPGLLAGLLSRGGDQPKLSHGSTRKKKDAEGRTALTYRGNKDFFTRITL